MALSPGQLKQLVGLLVAMRGETPDEEGMSSWMSAVDQLASRLGPDEKAQLDAEMKRRGMNLREAGAAESSSLRARDMAMKESASAARLKKLNLQTGELEAKAAGRGLRQQLSVIGPQYGTRAGTAMFQRDLMTAGADPATVQDIMKGLAGGDPSAVSQAQALLKGQADKVAGLAEQGAAYSKTHASRLAAAKTPDELKAAIAEHNAAIPGLTKSGVTGLPGEIGEAESAGLLKALSKKELAAGVDTAEGFGPAVKAGMAALEGGEWGAGLRGLLKAGGTTKGLALLTLLPLLLKGKDSIKSAMVDVPLARNLSDTGEPQTTEDWLAEHEMQQQAARDAAYNAFNPQAMSVLQSMAAQGGGGGVTPYETIIPAPVQGQMASIMAR